MGIVASLKGLFRRADTGAAGPAVADPPQTTTEGATSVPTQPEAVGSVLDPASTEGSGLDPTVDPELGSATESTASPREIPVTDSESPAQKVEVETSLPTKTEKPTTSLGGVESAVPPSSSTASE